MTQVQHYLDQFKSKISTYSDEWETDEHTNMWVLDTLDFKTNGVFIEAGAAGLSDSLVLEKYYGWYGVCVEPHTDSYYELIKKRRKTVINKCLYNQTGFIDFYECKGEIPGKTNKNGGGWASEQLSGITAHIRPWHIEDVVSTGIVTQKETVTVEKLLADFQFPQEVDLLILDIEGAEQLILESLPFDRYTFLTLVIEGGSEYRRFLYNHGYVMVENPYRSEPYYDFYYIHNSLVGSYPYKIYSLEELDQLY